MARRRRRPPLPAAESPLSKRDGLAADEHHLFGSRHGCRHAPRAAMRHERLYVQAGEKSRRFGSYSDL